MGSVGLMRIVATVPCDHRRCVDGMVKVNGCRFNCPTCNGTGLRPVYEPSGGSITIQGVPARTVSRSDVLGDQ